MTVDNAQGDLKCVLAGGKLGEVPCLGLSPGLANVSVLPHVQGSMLSC